MFLIAIVPSILMNIGSSLAFTKVTENGYSTDYTAAPENPAKRNPKWNGTRND